MKKRLCSLFLCLTMALSLFCVPAQAASGSLKNFQKSQVYTQGQYSDVPATNTFAANVKAGWEYGIMQGYGTTFGVANSITRLASIIIACRLNTIYYTGANKIAEQYTGTTQEIHLAYAKEHGIYCDFTDFGAAATRAEFATILSSALPDKALPEINQVDDDMIPDVKMEHPAAEPIYRLYRAGILNGSDAKGTFYPNTNITRGAACAIATRMCAEDLRKTVTLKTPVTEKLTITTQPKGVTVEKGESVTFTVAVSGGTEPYDYQWYSSKDGSSWSKLSGQTKAKCTINEVTDFTLQYRCVITDDADGKVTSNAVKITEKKAAPLTIKTQPKDVTVAYGGSATFSVEATGGKGPYTYRWEYLRSDSTSWQNAFGEQSVYAIPGVNAFNWQYRCIITDADGNTVTSNPANLLEKKVAAPLTIKTQPQDVTVEYGKSATFSVEATGGKEPYTYQWEYLRSDSTLWKSLGTQRVYQISTVNVFNWQYRCVITDADGNTVTSNPANLLEKKATAPLTIKTQPKDFTLAKEGDTATMTVEVSGGTAPYTYKWSYRDDGDSQWWGLADTNSPSLTSRYITVLSRSYRCTITDANGTKIVSNEARLVCKATEAAPLTIKTQPKDVTVEYGGSATFSVEATGGKEPYTYQWEYLGSDSTLWKPLGTQRVYKINTVNVFNWQYRCVITDANGNTVTSNPANLLEKKTATAPLTIKTQPKDAVVEYGKSATFSVEVTGGTEPYSYQWYLLCDGKTYKVSSGTGSSNTTGGVQDFSVTYYCVITDANGNKVTTRFASVTEKK